MLLYNTTDKSSIDTYFTTNPEKLSIKNDILNVFSSWVQQTNKSNNFYSV
jgi:hypothetical protein